MSYLNHQQLTYRDRLREILDSPLKPRIVACRLGIKPQQLESFLEASPMTLAKKKRFPRWVEKALVIAKLSPASLAFVLSDLQRDPNDEAKIRSGYTLQPQIEAKRETWDKPWHMAGISFVDDIGVGDVGFIDVLRRDQDLADRLFAEEIATGWFQVRVHEKLPEVSFC